MQYTIENDLLDFSFDLRQQPTTGNIETNEANQWYGVPLPAGYTFGDLSSYPDQATTDITYKKLGVGAVDWTATSGSGNTAFILADTSRNMFVPVYQNYLGQYTFVVTNNQFLTWTAFRLNFSVTDVPLVSI